MRDDRDRDDYEVGYRKPPKSGRFKKGASGNPSGRPRKPLGFGSLQPELNQPLTITENGKQKVITKREGIKKQLLNKALTGNPWAIREARIWDQHDVEKAAEEEKQAQYMETRTVRDMTDEELLAFIIGEIKAELKKSHSAAEIADLLAEVVRLCHAKPELLPVICR